MSSGSSNKRARTAEGSSATSSASAVVTEAALKQRVDSLPPGKLPALLKKLFVSHPDAHATFESLIQEALQEEKERIRLLPPADFSDLVSECEYELKEEHDHLEFGYREEIQDEVEDVIHRAREQIEDYCKSDEKLQTQLNGIRALLAICLATLECDEDIAEFFNSSEPYDDDLPGTIVRIFNRMVAAHKDEQPGSAASKSIKQLAAELTQVDIDGRLNNLA